MRKEIYVIFAVVLILVILSAAVATNQPWNQAQDEASNHSLSQSQSSATNQTATVQATNHPLKLTMTINKTNLKLGEPVNITFILENIGNETLILYFFDGHDAFDFIVYDQNSTMVYKSYIFYPQMYIPSEMKPGETHSRTWTWWQDDGSVYQGLDKDPPLYYTKVPAGTYRIIGLFTSRTLGITLETSPITLAISE